MKVGPLPDALKPTFTMHWIRGSMAFQLARRTRTVVLMVPTWPESGFRGRAARQGRVSWDVDGGG